MIRDFWRGTLVVNGNPDADDVRRTRNFEVDGTFVSRHFGERHGVARPKSTEGGGTPDVNPDVESEDCQFRNCESWRARLQQAAQVA